MENATPQAICFQFTPSKDDYIKTLHAAYIRSKRIWLTFAAFVILSLCALSAILAGHSGDDPLWFVALLIPILGIVYLLVRVLVLGPISLGRRVRKHERLTSETFWQADGDQILIRTQFAETKTDWGAFQKVIETKHYYLLVYTARSAFYFIPKRAFESQEQEAAFRDLLRRNLGG